MAQIVSQAGDIKMDIQSLDVQGDELVLGAIMGVWDSEVRFSPEEVGRILLNGLKKPALIIYLFRLPVIALKRRIGQRRTQGGTQ